MSWPTASLPGVPRGHQLIASSTDLSGVADRQRPRWPPSQGPTELTTSTDDARRGRGGVRPSRTRATSTTSSTIGVGVAAADGTAGRIVRRAAPSGVAHHSSIGAHVGQRIRCRLEAARQRVAGSSSPSCDHQRSAAASTQSTVWRRMSSSSRRGFRQRTAHARAEQLVAQLLAHCVGVNGLDHGPPRSGSGSKTDAGRVTGSTEGKPKSAGGCFRRLPDRGSWRRCRDRSSPATP